MLSWPTDAALQTGGQCSHPCAGQKGDAGTFSLGIEQWCFSQIDGRRTACDRLAYCRVNLPWKTPPTRPRGLTDARVRKWPPWEARAPAVWSATWWPLGCLEEEAPSKKQSAAGKSKTGGCPGGLRPKMGDSCRHGATQPWLATCPTPRLHSLGTE